MWRQIRLKRRERKTRRMRVWLSCGHVKIYHLSQAPKTDVAYCSECEWRAADANYLSQIWNQRPFGWDSQCWPEWLPVPEPRDFADGTHLTTTSPSRRCVAQMLFFLFGRECFTPDGHEAEVAGKYLSGDAVLRQAFTAAISALEEHPDWPDRIDADLKYRDLLRMDNVQLVIAWGEHSETTHVERAEFIRDVYGRLGYEIERKTECLPGVL